MGNSKGWDGLIGNKTNYNRVTFDALSKLTDSERQSVLSEVMQQAKVRYANRKAGFLDRNYKLIVEMGGLEQAKKKAFAAEGTVGKIAFLTQFHGIGDKYGRNIWMDVYHPDFHNSIAIDQRIKRITEALGYTFKTYKEHEGFYQELAKDANLQAWELDRLLYQFRDYFLSGLGD